MTDGTLLLQHARLSRELQQKTTKRIVMTQAQVATKLPPFFFFWHLNGASSEMRNDEKDVIASNNGSIFSERRKWIQKI